MRCNGLEVRCSIQLSYERSGEHLATNGQSTEIAPPMAYPLSQEAMTVSDNLLMGRVPTLGAPLSLRARVARSLRASITAGELKPGRVYSVPTLA